MLVDVAETVAPRLTPAERPAPPPAPGITLSRADDGRARLDWTLAPGASEARALTITINSKDEAAPPRTINEEIDGTAGTIMLDGIDPTKRYDVFVSDVDADGIASESVRRDLDAEA